MRTLIKITLIACLITGVNVVLAGNGKTDPPVKQETTTITANSSKDITDGGFFLHVGAMFPSKNYFCPVSYNNSTSERFSTGVNFEAGSMFKLVKLLKKTIGIRVTWLSANYTTYKYQGKIYDQILQGSVLKCGPYFTYGINDDMAVDIFYQINPTYAIDLKDTSDNSGYMGVTHSFGLGYRFKILSVGFDFNFGHVKYIDPPILADDDMWKPRLGYIRLFAGLKF